MIVFLFALYYCFLLLRVSTSFRVSSLFLYELRCFGIKALIDWFDITYAYITGVAMTEH